MSNSNLHQNANPFLFKYANEMRKNATEAEELLWQRIRNRRIARLKFRRQHPLDKFIADFYCHGKRLVIELDGAVHNSKEAKEMDEARTNELAKSGITVIRFSNSEVMNDIERVVKRIIEAAARLPTIK